MLEVAELAQENWDPANPAKAQAVAEKQLKRQSKQFTNTKDFEFFWPEEDQTLLVVYHPDTNKDLSDPRTRELEYNLATGHHEVFDRYPTTYQFVAFAILSILGGLMFLFVRWAARPMQKSYAFDGRMAQKQVLNDSDALELMQRMKSRNV